MTVPMSDERLAEISIIRDLTPVSLEAREALTELLSEVKRLRNAATCDATFDDWANKTVRPCVLKRGHGNTHRDAEGVWWKTLYPRFLGFGGDDRG